MPTIPNDEHGIPGKELYKAIARQLKKGLFPPSKIDEEKARACDDLKLEAEVQNLDFLRFFPNLDTLTITSAALTDISGLRHTPKLDWLAIRDHSLTDITPITQCQKLEFLQLEVKEVGENGAETGRTSKITDWRPITKLPLLNALSLHHAGVTELSWIPALPKLQYVVLSHNQIADFTPLLELPLHEDMELELDAAQYAAAPPEIAKLNIEHFWTGNGPRR